MSKIIQNTLIQLLLSLNLEKDDFSVFGSGPMFGHGLIELTNDLDIIARGKAWEQAKKFGGISTENGTEKTIKLFNKRIEIGNYFYPGNFDTNELIDTSNIIEEIRFVRLENVLTYKKILNRPKDIIHIKIIEKYLKLHM